MIANKQTNEQTDKKQMKATIKAKPNKFRTTQKRNREAKQAKPRQTNIQSALVGKCIGLGFKLGGV